MPRKPVCQAAKGYVFNHAPRRRPVGPSCREGLLCADPSNKAEFFTRFDALLVPLGRGDLLANIEIRAAADFND